MPRLHRRSSDSEPALTFARRFLPGALAALLVFVPAAVAQEAGDEPKDETPKTTIAGQVVDPDGNPVQDATVLGLSSEAKPVQRPVSPLGIPRIEKKDHEVAEATTGEDGRFRLEVEGPEPFMLRADSEGFAPSAVTTVESATGTVLHLTKGWTVRGQVFDKLTGKPMAAVEVTARGTANDGFADDAHRDRFSHETTTDAEGWFGFTDLEPNYYFLLAVKDDYSEAVVTRLAVGLQGGTPDDVYLYLMPGVTLKGTVVTADGAPVEGARVNVRPEQTIPGQMQRWMQSGGFGDKSDEEGAFTIKGVPVTASYVVEANHEDYAPTTTTGIRVKQGMASSPLKIVLDEGTSLRVRLVDEDRTFTGKVSFSLVYSVAGSEFSPRVGRGAKDVTLEAGKRTIRHLPAGKARLTIAPEGFSNVVRDEVTLSADEPLDLGEILLESGLRVTGRVLDEKGKPLADAKIEAMSMGAGGLARETCETDDEGNFRLGGLQDIAYTVSAEAEGYGRGSLKDIKPDGEPVEIRLQKAGEIRGRVVAGDPPVPVAGFSVESQEGTSILPPQLQMVGMGRSKMSFRDPGGQFAIGGLAEDTFKLKIEAAGFVPQRLEKVEVVPGETTDLGDILLERGATLSGTVREKDSGRPVGGAVVKLEQPGMFNMSGFMQMGVAALMTGPDGSFTLSGLAPGRHTVRVDHERFSTRKEEFEIAAGVPPTDLTVELSTGGAIEGTYRDKEGKPIQGGMVIAMLGFTPDPNTMGSTDEIGHFHIENLTPGTYRVMALPSPNASGQEAMLAQMQMQTIEVAEGETAIVNIPRDAGTIAVSGTVRKGVERIKARLVWVRMASDDMTPEDFVMSTSDESGSFQVRLTEPGEYRVSVQRMEQTDSQTNPGMALKVEIPDEPEVTKDLVISEVVVSGTVLDASTGERLAKVQVAAVEYREGRELRESIMASATVTDEEGRYRLEGLGNDGYKLIFSKEGYGAQTLGPIELDSETKEEGLDAALDPVSDAAVRVSDMEGNPVEGAFVTSLDFPALAIGGTTAQTDMDGQAVLKGLSDGAHDLGVIATGYAPAVARDVIVPVEGSRPVTIEVMPGGPLLVRVVDAEKKPVSKATVRIREEGGSDVTSLLQFTAIMAGRGLITGSDGTLRIANVASGTYEVEIRWQERVEKQKARVQAGKENELTVSLR